MTMKVMVTCSFILLHILLHIITNCLNSVIYVWSDKITLSLESFAGTIYLMFDTL